MWLWEYVALLSDTHTRMIGRYRTTVGSVARKIYRRAAEVASITRKSIQIDVTGKKSGRGRRQKRMKKRTQGGKRTVTRGYANNDGNNVDGRRTHPRDIVVSSACLRRALLLSLSLSLGVFLLFPFRRLSSSRRGVSTFFLSSRSFCILLLLGIAVAAREESTRWKPRGFYNKTYPTVHHLS